MDYSIFYKSEIKIDEDWHRYGSWDIFISAYNSSDRVKFAYDRIDAKKKHWLIFPEYNYLETEYPKEECFPLSGEDESEVMGSYLSTNSLLSPISKICIDATGFIRPHLIYLVQWLMMNGIKKFDVIYSEPSQYREKETTKFSDENVTVIRQIHGYEGSHNQVKGIDLLIIGSGYDDKLISQVAYDKNTAKKIQIFGLPSLRAEMYQENILRVEKAAEAVGRNAGETFSSYFAPAYDPFITANVLSSAFKKASKFYTIENLYLCPLSTKPQVLGFALYYLYEHMNKSSSILFPFCKNYARETSIGISRVWKYGIELPEYTR